MNDLFMKITSYVCILSFFFYFVFVQPSFNVLAASVSSLPKDLDISVDFDSDNIYVSYNGYDTTISRHTSTTFDNVITTFIIVVLYLLVKIILRLVIFRLVLITLLFVIRIYLQS